MCIHLCLSYQYKKQSTQIRSNADSKSELHASLNSSCHSRREMFGTCQSVSTPVDRMTCLHFAIGWHLKVKKSGCWWNWRGRTFGSCWRTFVLIALVVCLALTVLLTLTSTGRLPPSGQVRPWHTLIIQFYICMHKSEWLWWENVIKKIIYTFFNTKGRLYH